MHSHTQKESFTLLCNQTCKQDIAAATAAAGCSAAAKETRHVCRQQINENKVARVATPEPRQRDRLQFIQLSVRT